MRSLVAEPQVDALVLGDSVDATALEHMAFNGHSDRLHAVFRSLREDQRRQFGSQAVLRQVFVGGLGYLRQLPVDAASLRDAQIAFLDSLVRAHAAACEGDGAFNREYFRSALEWCTALFDEAHLLRVEELCEHALAHGAADFPALYPRFVLLHAAIREARGEVSAADAELQRLFARRDLVSDWKVHPEIVLALGRCALLCGRYPAFTRLLFDGLHSFYPGLDERRAILDLLRRAYPRGRWLRAGLSWGDKTWLAIHWAFFAAHRRAGAARVALGRAFLGGLYVTRYLRPAARRNPAAPRGAGREVLVTRAMGGLGDLLMLTPGLRAVRERNGEPVNLALPRRHFSLFAGNDDVRLLDIHEELDHGRYGFWHNLTQCPAARAESLSAPRVRRNRVELFARALGVRGLRLRRMDRRPRYVLSEAEQALQRRFFEEHGLTGRRVVGVQLRSEEAYRDYPHMGALVRELAGEWPVIAFAERRPPGFDADGALLVEGRPLREAFAIAAGCAAVVAPDSAFVHLAAALSIPCVALYGPTDGRVRTADYPLCRYQDARRALHCVPCWRNDDMPCQLTGMKASVCLGAIETATVRAALQEVLGEPEAAARR